MTANEMLRVRSEAEDATSDEAVPSTAPVDNIADEYDDGPAEEYSNGLIDEMGAEAEGEGEGEETGEGEGE